MNFWKGVGVMFGTIVGAGFLALPYLAEKSGSFSLLVWLFVLTLVASTLHSIYGEIVTATPGAHRLPGYASRYLGVWGKRAAGLSLAFGQIGTLVIYLILGGSFLGAILPSGLIPNPYFIFWSILTLILLLRFRMSAAIDAIASGLLLAVLLAISIVAVFRGAFSNIFAAPNGSFFLPYGAVMFSLVGISAVPEVSRIAAGDKKTLKRILWTATALAGALYAVFAVSVIAASGPSIRPNALFSAMDFFPVSLRWVLPLAGLLAVGTSYFIFSTVSKNSLRFDFGISPNASIAIVALTPLTLYALGLHDFLRLIGFMGGVWVSLDAAILILARERMAKFGIGERLSIYRRILHASLMALMLLGTISSLMVKI